MPTLRAAALFVLAIPFLALGAHPEPPETLAGRQLAWLIETANGAEPGPMEGRFSPEFIAAVPEPQFALALTQIRSMGPVSLVEVERSTEHALVAVLFGQGIKGNLRATVGVNPETELVETFLVQLAPDYGRAKAESWDEIGEAFAELPGLTNLGVYEITDGVLGVVYEQHADRALPIGSTFKLWVLGAVAEMFDESEKTWGTEIPVRDELKSLPSGVMQNEPEGATFTVAHYADQMISISDNTATDHLIDLAGRERVEEYMARFVRKADANRPFLMTREMFALKLGGDRDLLERFAEAEPEQRRAMLEDLPKPKAWLIAAWAHPVEIERVEWFANARELGATMLDLSRLGREHPEVMHALSINPGIPFDDQVWTSVAYKGGSEPGVLNMTWMVQRGDERGFVVSAGWANTEGPVDINRLIAEATRVFELLADE